MSLPVGEYSPFSISLRDKGGEIGVMAGYGRGVDVSDTTADLLAWSTFRTSVLAITLGQIYKSRYITEVIANPVANASSPSAQRENKLLVRFHDQNTLQKATITIPTIDLPNLVFETDARDYVSKTDWGAGGTVMSDFVAAFEAFVRVPVPDQVPGNPIVVDSLEYVGRNT